MNSPICPFCGCSLVRLGISRERLTVAVENEGKEVLFCRCPFCVEDFLKQPADLLAKLAL